MSIREKLLRKAWSEDIANAFLSMDNGINSGIFIYIIFVIGLIVSMIGISIAGMKLNDFIIGRIFKAIRKAHEKKTNDEVIDVEIIYDGEIEAKGD